MGWLVVDCHQFLSMEEGSNRIVFTPVSGRVVDVVLNSIYGTRILIPEDKVPTTTDTATFRNDVCKYLKENLKLLSAGGSTNNAGKFLRVHFLIERHEYRISDIQYVQ